MKTSKLFLFGSLFFVFIFSGCGISYPLTTNVNNHVTNVELSRKNFKVIASVKGESKAIYVLGFGGFGHILGFGGLKRALVEKAKADMMKNVDLIGAPRAVINETVEMHVANYIVFAKLHVMVSAHVIEFTE